MIALSGPTLRIVMPSGRSNGRDTRVFVGAEDITNYVRSIETKVDVAELTRVTLELIGIGVEWSGRPAPAQALRRAITFSEKDL